MGGIVWDEWARLMCLTSAFVIFGGGIMGIFQPLPAFSVLGNLKGLYAAEPVPILPAILVVLGIIVWTMEWPLIMPEYFNSSRSFMPKVAFYIPVAVLSLLLAQAINGGVYLAIGIVAYMMAVRADFLKQSSASGSFGRLP
ncbi:hypothetical protein BGX29_001684 [Mortierella sp. GBA35]|nr:hypothetical protein BGX29_001684 [Mortierella sp. GBA35]KAF9091206.1 hypothetical protein BGX23_005378 [Mortierella sp. AD031]KAG0208617.1 hypothetical protein BGX33_006140 [Mortierella sp. NVP41]